MRRAALLPLLLAAGCTIRIGNSEPAVPEDLERPGTIVVRGTPLVRQVAADDCGAASLAMVLGRHGVAADPVAIAAGCGRAPQGGIEFGALREHARSLGFEAYALPGHFGDLERELGKGRPAIVGLRKRTPAGDWYHVEVVVGWNPGTGRVVTLDPDRGLRRYEVQGFAEEWLGAGSPLLVVIPRSR